MSVDDDDDDDDDDENVHSFGKARLVEPGVTVRLMIASAKYLHVIVKINSMLIRGNAKRVMYSVTAKQRSPVIVIQRRNTE